MAHPAAQDNRIPKAIAALLCIATVSAFVGVAANALQQGLTELGLLHMMICGSALTLITLFRGIAARSKKPVNSFHG